MGNCCCCPSNETCAEKCFCQKKGFNHLASFIFSLILSILNIILISSLLSAMDEYKLFRELIIEEENTDNESNEYDYLNNNDYNYYPYYYRTNHDDNNDICYFDNYKKSICTRNNFRDYCWNKYEKKEKFEKECCIEFNLCYENFSENDISEKRCFNLWNYDSKNLPNKCCEKYNYCSNNNNIICNSEEFINKNCKINEFNNYCSNKEIKKNDYFYCCSEFELHCDKINNGDIYNFYKPKKNLRLLYSGPDCEVQYKLRGFFKVLKSIEKPFFIISFVIYLITFIIQILLIIFDCLSKIPKKDNKLFHSLYIIPLIGNFIGELLLLIMYIIQIFNRGIYNCLYYIYVSRDFSVNGCDETKICNKLNIQIIIISIFFVFSGIFYYLIYLPLVKFNDNELPGQNLNSNDMKNNNDNKNNNADNNNNNNIQIYNNNNNMNDNKQETQKQQNDNAHPTTTN